MSDKVTLSGRLPDDDGNGLKNHYGVLAEEGGPEKPLVVIGLVDQDKWSLKKSSGEASAVARITRLEVVKGGDAQMVMGLLRAVYAERTGNTPLPDDEGWFAEADGLADPDEREWAEAAPLRAVEGDEQAPVAGDDDEEREA